MTGKEHHDNDKGYCRQGKQYFKVPFDEAAFCHGILLGT